MPFAYIRRQYIGHRMTIQEKTINKPVFIALAKTGDHCHWLPGDQCGRSATILSPVITPLPPSDSELLQNGPRLNSPRSLRTSPDRTVYKNSCYALRLWRTEDLTQELELTG
ncbi:hypothetical protein Pan110_25130 [Gimesia panareensis]|nr:hypothetical protein Pan110_25130 [Gimesia panareensis]